MPYYREAIRWDQVKQKAQRWSKQIKGGKVQGVIQELQSMLEQHRNKKKRQVLEGEINYLRSGKKRMNYPLYLSLGLPIGSGAVEGSCKYLIKHRFNRAGARWTDLGIKTILALRLLQANDDWERLYQKMAA